MPQISAPRGNHLLNMLPPGECRRFQEELEQVELPLGASLCEPYQTMRYAYFPIDALVSLLCLMEDGSSAEISVVGFEGIVGVSLFMGGETTPSRAVVQSAGSARRVPGSVLKELFSRSAVMQRLLLRYAQALLTQMAQTAVCNRHHCLDRQLCRWLLLSHDRVGGRELHMTQELIANMLGVRREGVTHAASKLQEAGLIRYHRGHIKILDTAGLEARACECYGVVKREYERLLPDMIVR